MRRELIRIASVVLAVALLGTAIALAAGPVKGAKYTGSVKNAPAPTTISFKVSSSGKTVKKVVPSPDFPLPPGCGPFGAEKYLSKPAKVKNGKFTAKILFKTVTGSKLPAGTVKGTFKPKKKEAGTITAIKALGDGCDKSYSYTTKAS